MSVDAASASTSTATSAPSPTANAHDAPCATCTRPHAKYTCPRCTTRTCSLACSRTHKERTGCTGERDRARFVPMNAYGLGTLMDDYVFLEDVGRKVSDLGREIVRGGFAARRSVDGMRGRGGRGGGRGRRQGQLNRRDVFKLQMEARSIDVDLLPPGMSRRNQNQSTWDVKKQTALLTVEFTFHPPTGTNSEPYTLLTHRNDLRRPLLDLLRSHVLALRKKSTNGRAHASAPPEWLAPLVLADDDDDDDDSDTFVPPECYLPVVLDPLTTTTTTANARAGFRGLDPAKPLAVLLRNQHFTEFPTIAVFESGAFDAGVIVDEAGVVLQQEEEEVRPAKRRRVDAKVVDALLSGYGSADDDDADEDGAGMEDTTTPVDSLTMAGLGEYEGSSDIEDANEGLRDGAEEEEIEGEEEGVPGPVDYAALLDLMRQAKETGVALDDEAVDWGDSEDDTG